MAKTSKMTRGSKYLLARAAKDSRLVHLIRSYSDLGRAGRYAESDQVESTIDDLVYDWVWDADAGKWVARYTWRDIVAAAEALR